MNNIVKNNHFEPQGIAGFFGWLKRTIGNLINAVVEVSRNPTIIIKIARDAVAVAVDLAVAVDTFEFLSMRIDETLKNLKIYNDDLEDVLIFHNSEAYQNIIQKPP